MDPKIKICAVSGSRADFGILYWPLRLIREHSRFALEVVPTGMHLSPKFGSTIDEIESAGFATPHVVEILEAGDDPRSMSRGIARGIEGFSDWWQSRRPDLVILLGDRFEIFAAAQAAYIAKIPIVHLCGGDVTMGSLDDGFRHSISKMASIHLVSHDAARQRLIRMGEEPNRIFVVGNPSLDSLRRETLLERTALEALLGFKLLRRNFVVTFHPSTLDPGDVLVQIDELLAALAKIDSDTRIVISISNADAGGIAMSRRIAEFAHKHQNVRAVTSIGHLGYLSLVAQADLVLGNSSSGILEVPSLGKPTVNIGSRQAGRLHGPSVVDCEPDRHSIIAAIESALRLDCSTRTNLYGDGRSSERILEVLLGLEQVERLAYKGFWDG